MPSKRTDKPAEPKQPRKPRTPKAEPIADPIATAAAGKVPAVDMTAVLRGLAAAPMQEMVREATTAPVMTSGEAYFTLLSSNIKGGFTTQLGPCTAFVSPQNRRGKTARLDAITLALRGKHAVGDKGSELLSLANGSSLHASLTGKEASAKFEIPEGKMSGLHTFAGKLEGISAADAARIMPLYPIDDILALGTKKAREEFFLRFGAEAQSSQPIGLSKEQQAMWDLYFDTACADLGLPNPNNPDTQAISKDASLITAAGDVLAKMTELMRRDLRHDSTRIKSYVEEGKKARAEIAAAALPVVTDAQISAAEAEVKTHQKLERASTIRTNYAAQQAKYKSLEEQKALLGPLPAVHDEVAKQKRLEAIHLEDRERVQLESTLATLNQNNQRILTIYDEQKALVAQITADPSKGVCYCCFKPLTLAEAKANFDSSSVVVAQIVSERARLEVAVAEQKKLVTKLMREDKAALDAEIQQHQQRVVARQQIDNEMMTVYTQLQGYEQLWASEGLAAVDPATVPDVAGKQAALAALKEQRRKFQAVEEAETNARNVTQHKLVLDMLTTAAQNQLQALLASVKTAAEKAVNKYMPEGFTAVLQLMDDVKPDYRWEVTGMDGFAHRYGAASGAEWGALRVAMACAWFEAAPIRILVLDDTDLGVYSPEALPKFLANIQARVATGDITQAFIAWTRPNEIPTGWLIHSL